MLIEDVGMCESLRRIVNGLTGDAGLQQDMLQECLVCLWRVETEKPGRTRSWYLQSCRFHVQHWLAAGRSLDSHKRARGGNRVVLYGTEEESVLDGYHTNGELFEAVSVRDLVSALSPLLQPQERTVLFGLAEGRVLREIASQCGISYPTALKYRRRIATLACRLGAFLPSSSRRENGGPHGVELPDTCGLKPLALKCREAAKKSLSPANKPIQGRACLKAQPKPKLQRAVPAKLRPKHNLSAKRILGTDSTRLAA